MKNKSVSPLMFGLILLLVSVLSVFIALLLVYKPDPNYSDAAETKKSGNQYCDRETPYNLAPEIDRVLSLIDQRFTESADAKPLANIVKVIRNCINVQYQPDNQMMGAEGLFMFNAQSTSNNLEIFISDRYKSSDDLLTATLMVHELTHAFFFATDKEVGCYENEGKAFANQHIFLANALNVEEKQSLISRSNSNPSREVVNMMNLVMAINSYNGDTIQEQATNMVRSNKFYQEQCGK